MSVPPFTRRPLQVVALRLPMCSLTFGVGACESVASTPCYNTDKSCTFRLGYDPTDELVLYFVENRPWDWSDKPGAFQPSLAIPSLESVRTSPTILNVAGGDRDKSPLSVRAVMDLRLKDHPYNYKDIDPYWEQRPDVQRSGLGSFWGRWVALWPFHVGFDVTSYEGYLGDALEDMVSRDYYIENVDRSSETIRIRAKDILRKVVDENITMPRQSPGELAETITFDSTLLIIAGASIEDYEDSNFVRINDEVIRYETLEASEQGGNLLMSGLLRGQGDTVPSNHQQFDNVQMALRYDNEPFQNILYEGLVEYAEIDAQFIDKDAWDFEKNYWRPAFNFTGWITEPTPVLEVGGEICQDSLCHLWYDERDKQIKLKAQRPENQVASFDDRDHIVSKSFVLKENEKERVTDVYLAYGRRSAIAPVDDKFSYRRIASIGDVDRRRQYGEPANKTLFSRWINDQATANTIIGNYLQRFKDTRKEANFDLDAKDIDSAWTGDVVFLTHYMIQDFNGEPSRGSWLLTSAEVVEDGLLYRYTAEDNDMAGVLWEWKDADVDPANWAAATPEQRESIGFWTDVNGNDPEGSPVPFRWL